MKKIFTYSIVLCMAVSSAFAQSIMKHTSSAKNDVITSPRTNAAKGGGGNNQTQALFDVQFNYNILPLTGMAGCAFTGTEFWASHWNQDSIYTYSPTGV